MTRTTLYRLFAAALSAAALVALLSGCAASSAPEKTAEEPAATGVTYPVTITDDAGRTVTVTAEPKRIVSLAPANTEILFAIGAGDRVVGVTSYDDYPEQVKDIEQVGDFSGPNLEKVAAAQPDLIVATTGVQADVVAKLEELGATVIAVDPQTLDGVYEDIIEVGTATNTRQEAAGVVAKMKADAAAIESKIAGTEPTTAFVEIGQNPLFTTGSDTLLGELIEKAGGKNVVAEKGYVPYSVEQLVASDPAVYLATKGSSNDPAAIAKRAGYPGLSAVKNDRVIIIDDSQVSRPGPRIIEGLAQIAEALHPEAFAQ